MDERDVDPVPRVPRVRREPSGANHTRSVARNAARSSTRGLARNSVSLAVTVGVLAVVCVALAVWAVVPRAVSTEELWGAARGPGEAAFVAAHRGDRSVAPENTLPAVQAAIDGEFDYVEVDIALTSDGVAVLLHDETLDRTTTGSGPLADHTFEQVRALDAGGWFDEAFAGTLVPTLDEFLAMLATSQKRALIEMKGVWTPVATAAFADALHAYGLDDRVAVASFDARTLALIEEAAPRVPRMAILRVLPEDTVAAARALGVRGIVASSKVISRAPHVIEELHRAGMRVAVYTLNDDTKWQRALDIGVDGIITDKPAVLSQWLAESTAPPE